MYPVLGALTWDVFFVWTISTLFFTTQKGLSYSQVVLLDSILMAFGALLVVPVSKLFQNISPLKSVRLGNLGYAVYLLLCIFGTNYLTFVCAQLFLAFGYAVNSVKTNVILIDSLALVKRGKDYQRISGKSGFIFYLTETIVAIFGTMIYAWNPYFLYWASFVVAISIVFYTMFMREPSKYQESNVEIDAKVTTQKTKKPDSFMKILKSGFFVSMLVYMFFFRGIVSILGSAFKVYLQQITSMGVLPIAIYGLLYAGTKLSAAISSKFQFKFDLKFGVRSLVIFNLVLVVSFLFNGLSYILNPFSVITLVGISAMSYLQHSLRSPNTIFMNNYMSVCMPKRNFERAMAIRVMVEYAGYAVISAVFAALLSGFNDNYGLTNLVYIGMFAIPLLISMIVFVRLLCKKYAQKYTIIKDEYTKD